MDEVIIRILTCIPGKPSRPDRPGSPVMPSGPSSPGGPSNPGRPVIKIFVNYNSHHQLILYCFVVCVHLFSKVRGEYVNGILLIILSILLHKSWYSKRVFWKINIGKNANICNKSNNDNTSTNRGNYSVTQKRHKTSYCIGNSRANTMIMFSVSNHKCWKLKMIWSYPYHELHTITSWVTFVSR